MIDVRSLMTGRRTLHVLADGDRTNDLQPVSRDPSKLGIEIDDEGLLADELFDPYEPFDPDGRPRAPAVNDFIELTGNAEILAASVAPDTPVAGASLEEVTRTVVLDDDTLVIAIERDDEGIVPHWDTVTRPDDVVTLLSRQHVNARASEPFQNPVREETSPG